MKNIDSKYSGHWMTWTEIVPYKQQLVDMELDLMHTYHYPDRLIPREYAEGAVDRLEGHLASGNTFFWGVVDGERLLGYYWGYSAMFIDSLRWHTRSVYFREELKGLGFGEKALCAGLEKAKEIGCKDAATEYVPFNKAMASLVNKCGYEITRIEVVTKL